MKFLAPQHLMQLVVLIILFVLLFQQLLHYNSEPLHTTASRRPGQFPRLTICPTAPAPMHLLTSPLQRLANESIDMTEFFDTATIKLRGKSGRICFRYRVTDFNEAGGLGVWREKYYMQALPFWNLAATRCITFETNGNLNLTGSRRPVSITLTECPIFQRTRLSYRLFVHGVDVPNVDDLSTWAPSTESVPLRSGEHVHFSISARRTERVSVRRRPCSSRPGYSKAQCLKECQWRRLVAHTGCRLPHMVGADTFLPKMGGFMDHLPLCSRLPRRENKSMQSYDAGLPENSCMKLSKLCHFTNLDEEYLLYSSQSSKTSSSKAAHKAIDRDDNLTPNFSSDGRTSSLSRNAIHPTSKPTPATERSPPPSKPPPPPAPPLAQDLPLIELPAEAFSFLPLEAFEFSYAGCQCHDACHETTYTLVEKKTMSRNGDNPCTVNLMLTFDFTEEVIVESLAITLPDLIAGIGGNVGLFTGFSLLTLVELFARFLRLVLDKMRGWRRRRAENETSMETKKRGSQVSPRVPMKQTLKGNEIEFLDV